MQRIAKTDQNDAAPAVENLAPCFGLSRETVRRSGGPPWGGDVTAAYGDDERSLGDRNATNLEHQEECSFLKKRTKRLLCPCPPHDTGSGRQHGGCWDIKVF
jgi:hypothetical protein